MRADEEGTINTWWLYRREIIDPTIEEFSGRIVKLTGDGFLAEFASANNAVHAAYAIQRSVEASVREQPEHRRMRFRMGINLGDIFWDDEDIYGDDVNIAARLEARASPGSIIVSRAVFDKVKRTAQLTFEDLGEQRLKNISEPVRSYRVVGELLNHSFISGDPNETADREQESVSPNSLAVLPFAVFGDDPDQVYFADGFTDDLITELARFKELFVTSRNTSFALKGQNVDSREVGKKLGVAYCLEGSVRKLGDRIRITSQLINNQTGDHVWAEKYDCGLSELFDVQDDLAKRIVAMVAGRLERQTLAMTKNKRPADMHAYDCLLRGLEHHRLGGVTREHAEEALHWFNLSIEKDPGYGRAYAWRACATANLSEWTGEDALEKSAADGRRALELDDNDAESHRIMGSVSLYTGDYEKALYHFDQALNLNPSNAYIVGRMGEVHNFLGDGRKALEYQELARRLDPLLPSYCRELEAVAHYLVENYQETANVVSQFTHKSQRAQAYLAAALSHLDDEQLMLRAARDLQVINPNFTISNFVKAELYRDEAIRLRLRADLERAGLPDRF